MGFNGNIRFHTHTFGGHVVIHCHRLEHEDEGLMGVFYINGGCDADYSALGSGTCEPETCDSDALWSAYNWSVESVGFDGTITSNVTNSNNNTAIIVGVAIAGFVIVVVVRICAKKKGDAARSAANTNVETGGSAT